MQRSKSAFAGASSLRRRLQDTLGVQGLGRLDAIRSSDSVIRGFSRRNHMSDTQIRILDNMDLTYDMSRAF